MSEVAAWVIAFILLLAWLSSEYVLAAQRRATSIAYTQGIIKGAADQAAKPRTCSWQDLFGATK